MGWGEDADTIPGRGGRTGWGSRRRCWFFSSFKVAYDLVARLEAEQENSGVCIGALFPSQQNAKCVLLYSHK